MAVLLLLRGSQVHHNTILTKLIRRDGRAMSEREDSEQPLVSVVIPTYDRPTFLREALESVATQSYRPIEVIVVDDASPESVTSVVQETLPSAVEWQCIRHETNRGANAARNTGIDASSGDVVAFLDDDDRWEPNKLRVQTNALLTPEREHGVCLVGQRFVDETGRTTFIKRPRLSGSATRDLLTGAIAGPFSTIAVRRSVLEAAGYPDESLPSLQDRDWLLRLSEHTSFISVATPLIRRRSGAYGQIGDQYANKRDQTYPHFLTHYRLTAQTYGVESQFVAWLNASVAGSALRAGAYRECVQFSLRSLHSYPAHREAWSYLLASIGGDVTYRPAQAIKRRVSGGLR